MAPSAPTASLVVALHQPQSTEPQLFNITLPRTTSFGTTFEAIRKLVVIHSRRELGEQKVEEDSIRECRVDGMRTSWRSSPEQVSSKSARGGEEEDAREQKADEVFAVRSERRGDDRVLYRGKIINGHPMRE
jgi:hypothetical protein